MFHLSDGTVRLVQELTREDIKVKPAGTVKENRYALPQRPRIFSDLELP